MAIGRPLAALHVSDQSREQLKQMANSRTLPYALVRRAQIILMSADGMTNKNIGEKVGLSGSMVGLWRKRFIRQGIMGLYDEPRPGGPRTISDEQVARLIQHTLKQKPPDATHWSCRSIAKKTNLSKSTVQRIWRTFGIQ